MPQTLVGIIYGATTKRPYMTIKPVDDSELNNPAWLTLGLAAPEPLHITRVPNATYNSWTNFSQLVTYVSTQP